MRNVAFVAAIVLSSIGCGSTSRLCVPGMQITCSCPGGGSGVQVCNGAGTAYGDCTGCPASPSGGDMGTDSPVTYSTGGTYQYAVPAGVTSILVKVWGAGGGGREG